MLGKESAVFNFLVKYSERPTDDPKTSIPVIEFWFLFGKVRRAGEKPRLSLKLFFPFLSPPPALALGIEPRAFVVHVRNTHVINGTVSPSNSHAKALSPHVMAVGIVVFGGGVNSF